MADFIFPGEVSRIFSKFLFCENYWLSPNIFSTHTRVLFKFSLFLFKKEDRIFFFKFSLEIIRIMERFSCQYLHNFCVFLSSIVLTAEALRSPPRLNRFLCVHLLQNYKLCERGSICGTHPN